MPAMPLGLAIEKVRITSDLFADYRIKRMGFLLSGSGSVLLSIDRGHHLAKKPALPMFLPGPIAGKMAS